MIPGHNMQVYVLSKTREDADSLSLGRFVTMGQLDIYYWEHCGHDREEVHPQEIRDWYADKGWVFEKHYKEREEQHGRER